MARIDAPGPSCLNIPICDTDDVAAAPVDPAVSSQPAPASSVVVDAFDDTCRPEPTCEPPQPQPFRDYPTIKASQLALAPQKALQLTKAVAASPGSPKSVQTPIASDTTPSKAPESTRPAHVETPWISQYAPDVELKWPGTATVIPMGSRDSACAAACIEMLNRAGAQYSGANIDIAETRDPQGRFTTSREKADSAHVEIDKQLDAGKPVMVGVMWDTPYRKKTDKDGNPLPPQNGNNADHYVVITGRGIDEQGHEYYTFNDPAAGAARQDVGTDSRPANRFYVDNATGVLYRPSVRSSGYSSDARYEVSRVSVNK